MDEGDTHPSMVLVLSDDSSECIHLELKLLTLRNVSASWYSLNMKVNHYGIVAAYKCLFLGGACLLMLDCRLLKGSEFMLMRYCKFTILKLIIVLSG